MGADIRGGSLKSGLDGSRDPGDVTAADQSARARPSPAVVVGGGKRTRKAASTSAGGRAVPRPLPGYGETVDGPARRERLPGPAAAGPLSPTAAATSSRKPASSMSKSLTDVAARSTAGGGSPESVRRRATTTSRLAMPRAPGRPVRAARPASDGGGTAASCRGLAASRLPTGSVGAIGDGAAKTAAVELSSFHPGRHREQHRQQQQQQQQQSLKSDHRPVASASPSSITREQPIQLGPDQDTSPDILTDLPSSVAPDDALSTTHGTRNDTGGLPAEQEDCHDMQMDQQGLLEDPRFIVSDEHKNYQGLVEEKVLYMNVSGLQNDRQNVTDERTDRNITLAVAETNYQNFAGDHNSQECIFDERKNRVFFTDWYGISQIRQEDYPNKTVPEREEHQFVKTEDPNNVINGHGYLEYERLHSLGDDNQQFMIGGDGQMFASAASTYRDVGRTTSASGDVDHACETSSSSELDDVTLPPFTASSVTMTTSATGNSICHLTTITGE